jgi:uncharacterized membrane protein
LISKRIKAIDRFRGVSMLWMILGHNLAWVLAPNFEIFHDVIFNIVDVIGSSGFIFISGVSMGLSYKRRQLQMNNNQHRYRNRYLINAGLIVFVAIRYNSFAAVYMLDPTLIWGWSVLMTISVSMFLAWPLLKVNKTIRIIIGFIIWILDNILFHYLTQTKQTSPISPIILYLLYSPTELNPILEYFSFFLFGTVIGNILVEIRKQNKLSDEQRKGLAKKRLIYPLFIIGPLLTLFGIVLSPTQFYIKSFAWRFYSLGIMLIFFSFLFTIELYNLFVTKKSYRFLFFYSYYSLSIFLYHYILIFLFPRMFNPVSALIYISFLYVIITLLLRYIYKKWGSGASIKAQLRRASNYFADEIEKKRILKFREIYES